MPLEIKVFLLLLLVVAVFFWSAVDVSSAAAYRNKMMPAKPPRTYAKLCKYHVGALKPGELALVVTHDCDLCKK